MDFKNAALRVPTEGMAAYATTSLFQPHRARQAIRDAHEKKIPPMLCYYAGLSSIPITRFLAPLCFDAVWIDWEHSSCNVETMTTVSILPPGLYTILELEILNNIPCRWFTSLYS
jgi:hypothetical protein